MSKLNDLLIAGGDVTLDNLDDIEVHIRQYCNALATFAYYKATRKVCDDPAILDSLADHMYVQALGLLAKRWLDEEQYLKEMTEVIPMGAYKE